MADNKSVQDTAKKTPSSKAADLLASGRPAPRARRESHTNQYLMIAIAVAIIAVIGFVFLRKKPETVTAAKSAVGATTRRARKAAGEVAKREPAKTATTPAARPARKPAREPRDRARASGSSDSREARRRERAARLESRRGQRQTRTTPSSRSGRAARRTRDKYSKRAKTETSDLTGISGPNETRSALIGGRSYRVGDVVGGRIIREIGEDYVRVEYGGNNTNLLIGDKLP